MIVDSTAKKGMILFPEAGQYTELDLKETSFEGVYVEKVPRGEVTVDGRTYDTFRVAVIYGDASIQEGMLWESRDPKGVIKKIRLRNLSSRIVLELGDVDTTVPSDDIFRIPSGYVRTPEK
jgi:hypothetical protein